MLNKQLRLTLKTALLLSNRYQNKYKQRMTQTQIKVLNMVKVFADTPTEGRPPKVYSVTRKRATGVRAATTQSNS
jgi:hypothetical protein